MRDLHQRLRRRRLDTTATTMLREARLQGYSPPAEQTRGGWHEEEIHRDEWGRVAVFSDGRFVEGDPEYAREIREFQERIDDGEWHELRADHTDGESESSERNVWDSFYLADDSDG